MQSAEEKYKAAVQRNLQRPMTHRKNDLKGLTLEAARIKLGIRKDDHSYDAQVQVLIQE